ncbi:MAG: PspC domain-containing protein [Spirochaetaceae bacterium]|nr:PspC domain-containing protein [Spirochaetaceae bacterium]
MIAFLRKKISKLVDGLAPRIRSKKIIFGVCAGIANRYDFPADLVRLLFVMLSFPLGIGIVAYVLLAFFSKPID